MGKLTWMWIFVVSVIYIVVVNFVAVAMFSTHLRSSPTASSDTAWGREFLFWWWLVALGPPALLAAVYAWRRRREADRKVAAV